MKTRTIRAEIALANGGKSSQRFEVQGVDDAELERAAHVFAQGVLTVTAMFREEEILSLRIGWADQWNQPSGSALSASIN